MFEIRKNRTVAQGARTLVCEREKYFRLMDQGLSSRDACARVGINLRTGKRRRNGRNASGKDKARPPVLAPLSTAGPSRPLEARAGGRDGVRLRHRDPGQTERTVWLEARYLGGS